MADKTLIQGAQNIANARNTSGIGQAFSMGLDKSIAGQRAAKAAQAERDKKKAEAIQKRTEKYLNEWGSTNINNGEMSEGQLAEVHKAAKEIKKDFTDVVTRLGKDPTNMDLIDAKNGYLQELKSLRSAADDYADGYEVWKMGVKGKLYSKSVANIGNLGLNEQAYTEPVVWDRKSKALALPNSFGEDGKPLLYKNINLPFNEGNEAAKIIADKAGELSGTRKNDLSDFQLKNLGEEINELILTQAPAEGVDNMPALLANRKMRELFPEWKNIEYAASMTDDEKGVVAQEMTNAVMSRYKSVAEAASGSTPPPPRGFSETPTNQAWIRDVNKLAKTKVATEIQAPNGDYVIIIPRGVEYEGYSSTKPMMRIVGGIDKNGNPIYQIRPLDQGIIQTKKRK